MNGLRQQVGRAARRIGLLSREHPSVTAGQDAMDAPCMTAVEACLPVGDAVVIVPSFRSTRETDAIEPVRLGAATVRGANGAVRQLGIWQMQFSWYGGQSFLPPAWQIPPVPVPEPTSVETLAGPVLSTVPTFGTVYGHALLDELPLLLWLIEKPGRLSPFQTVLCSAVALGLLRRTRHPEREALVARARPADWMTLYDISDLTVLRRTGCRMNPSWGEMALLRAEVDPVLRPTPPGTPRRLFVDRPAESRSIRNRAEIVDVARRHGLSVIAPEDLDDPWACFAAADLVVGVAGSNLSDSVFMTPGAALLEILPSDHVKPYNWNVATRLGLTYRAILASSDVQRRTLVGPGNAPVHVPPEAFDRALEEVVASLPA